MLVLLFFLTNQVSIAWGPSLFSNHGPFEQSPAWNLFWRNSVHFSCGLGKGKDKSKTEDKKKKKDKNSEDEEEDEEKDKDKVGQLLIVNHTQGQQLLILDNHTQYGFILFPWYLAF